MMEFKCMKCGHHFEDPWSKDDNHEVACPQCKSNSCRRLKPGKTATPKK